MNESFSVVSVGPFSSSNENNTGLFFNEPGLGLGVWDTA